MHLDRKAQHGADPILCAAVLNETRFLMNRYLLGEKHERHHDVTIPSKLGHADHQDEMIPEPQAVWLRIPPAKIKMRVDKSGREWMDIHELVVVDSQFLAWDAIAVELQDADADILDGAREARREMV